MSALCISEYVCVGGWESSVCIRDTRVCMYTVRACATVLIAAILRLKCILVIFAQTAPLRIPLPTVLSVDVNGEHGGSHSRALNTTVFN